MSAVSTFVHPNTFVKLLSENGYDRRRPVDSRDAFDIHYLDLSSLKLRAGLFTPFLVTKSPVFNDPFTAAQLQDVVKDAVGFCRTVPDTFVVLVVGSTCSDDSTRLFETAADNHVAILQRSDIARIAGATDRKTRSKLLASSLVSALGREALQPYVYGRPAFGGRFFGRSSTLKSVLAGKGGASYTIMGNRRIGKTSLLREIKQRLSSTSDKLRSAELYGSKCNSTFDAILDLLRTLNPREANKITEKPNVVQSFPNYVREIIEKEQGEVVLFIDEFDHILDFDEHNRFELTHLLRNASDHPGCRVFIAGFRKVMAAREQMGHPMYNFGQSLPLTGLTLDETIDMVTKPLEHLGIQLPKGDLPATIYRETAGYPELIQIFCAEIIRLYDKESAVDETLLLDRVFQSESFKSAVLGSFLSNTFPHEALASYLLIREAMNNNVTVEDFEFDLDYVGDALKREGVRLNRNELWRLVQNLKVGGTFSSIDGTAKMRFSIPQLIRYCVRMNLDTSILESLEQVKLAPKISEALLTHSNEPLAELRDPTNDPAS